MDGGFEERVEERNGRERRRVVLVKGRRVLCTAGRRVEMICRVARR